MKTSFGWEPAMNVFETDGEFVVIMDISGMDPKDIAVFTDGNILRISGVRKDLIPPGKKQFHSLEIQVGPFQRLIGIPVQVDRESVTTAYANGLLEIRLKKRGDQPSKRRVDVE
jgi:HSP20 family protein